MCTTQAALEESDHSVTVRVLRGGSFTQSRSSSESTFRYAHPIASEPVPLQGPKAGGTEITIFGSNLDISSPGSLEVFIGDIQCDIMYANNIIIIIICTYNSHATYGEQSVMWSLIIHRHSRNL